MSILDETPTFEWTENKLEEGLAQLWGNDRFERHLLRRVMREIDDSHTLMASYTDALEACKRDTDKEHQVFEAMLARMYIAGTVRPDKLINQ